MLIPSLLGAKVFPGDGRTLNYRIIGFSFDGKEQTTCYKLQIAKGNYSDEKTFLQNVIMTASAKESRLIAEVPTFGTQYTWRIIYDGPKTTKSNLYHFSTLATPDVNPDSVRMRITAGSGKYKDDYVFVDCNKVLYDMEGNPVWFLPKIENNDPATIHLRDLKITPFGTITSIVNGRIYEFSYSTGNILWQGPENNGISMSTTAADRGYHHEFTRMTNGHYMVMGFEQPYWQLPQPPDSSVYRSLADKIKVENNKYYQKMLFGTVLEYDSKGAIVWQWKGSDYFETSDLRTRMLPSGLFDVNDTHANAFYLDEITKTMYISFRDINRVIEISYPGKNVLHTYGKLYTSVSGVDRDRHLANGMFCGQHSCRVLDDGNIVVFNNNICRRAAMPTVLKLKHPSSGKDTLEKMWEFDCPLDSGTNRSKMGAFSFGGNILELPGQELFVCMGGTCGKLFIVNKDKQVLWSAQPEKWDASINKWSKDGATLDNNMKEGSYRASIINRAELENLVWGEPARK